MSLYVDNATTPPWVKVYLDKATLPEVAAGLLRLLRCDTCGGSGKDADYCYHAKKRHTKECRPCPAPDCVNGIRLPDKMIEAAATALHQHGDYMGKPQTARWQDCPNRDAHEGAGRRVLVAGLAALEAEE